MLVVAGVIKKKISQEEKFLIALRKKDKRQGGLWEFPGGKVEQQEAPRQALKRELHEELGAYVEVQEFVGEETYSYKEYNVRLRAYFCSLLGAESFTLQDHEEIRWVNLQELCKLKDQLAPADHFLIPIITLSKINLNFLK